MADQPTGGAEISDDELDEAVNASWGDDSEPSTEAPDEETPGPDADDADGTPDTPPTDTAPAGDAPTAPTDDAHPAPDAASAPPVPAGKPFQFKASGGVHTLAGATELPDGSVVISKDAQADFRRELAHGRELHANFRQFQRTTARELQAAKTQRTEKDAEADAVIALMGDLLKMSLEEQVQYLAEFQGNVPRLQLDLREKQLAEKQRLFEERQKGPQVSEEEQREQFTELVKGELNATFQHIEQVPQFKALTATEKQKLRARYEQKPERLVRRAQQDDPARGITAGDLLFDPAELIEDCQLLVENRTPAAPPAAAAARNAALNADQRPRGNRIPPTVRAQPPVGQPRDKAGKFKTSRDKAYRDYLMSNDDEDDAA